MRKTGGHTRLLLVVLACLMPSAACANAGTPLIWAGMLHLFIGNALIGWGEGLLLAWLFRVPRARAIGVMVAANYFSAWVGAAALSSIQPRLASVTIYDAPQILWIMVALVFAATVILEWPFCIWMLKRGKSSHLGLMRTSLLASLIAQTLSYGVLVPWYAIASSTTLLSKTRVDRTLSFLRECPGTVYFVSKDGAICRVSCSGGRVSNVTGTGTVPQHQSLFLLLAPDLHYWNLYADDPRTPESARRIARRFAAVPSGAHMSKDDLYTPFLADLHSSADYHPSTEEGWSVYTDYWAAFGLRGTNRKTGEAFQYGFETPFVQWRAHSATVLPDGLVIYQLGDQIIALDLNTRQVGLLAMGRSPAVTYRNAEEVDREIREAFGRIRREEALRQDK